MFIRLMFFHVLNFFRCLRSSKWHFDIISVCHHTGWQSIGRDRATAPTVTGTVPGTWYPYGNNGGRWRMNGMDTTLLPVIFLLFLLDKKSQKVRRMMISAPLCVWIKTCYPSFYRLGTNNLPTGDWKQPPISKNTWSRLESQYYSFIVVTLYDSLEAVDVRYASIVSASLTSSGCSQELCTTGSSRNIFSMTQSFTTML